MMKNIKKVSFSWIFIFSSNDFWCQEKNLKEILTKQCTQTFLHINIEKKISKGFLKGSIDCEVPKTLNVKN